MSFNAFFRRLKELADPAAFERAQQRAILKQRPMKNGKMPPPPTRYDLAGYPRFKHTDIHGTLPFKAMGQGWKIEPSAVPGNGNNWPSEPGERAVSRRGARKSPSKCRNMNESPMASLPTQGDRRMIDPLHFVAPSGNTADVWGAEGGAVVLDHHYASGITADVGGPKDGYEAEKRAVPAGRHASAGSGRPNNWRLTCKGIPGAIKARGKFPAKPLSYRNAEIIFRDDCYWFSVCVEMELRMEPKRPALPIKVEFNLIDEFAAVKIASNGQRLPGLEFGFHPDPEQTTLRMQGTCVESPGDSPYPLGGDGMDGWRASAGQPSGSPRPLGGDGFAFTARSAVGPGDSPRPLGGDGGNKSLDLSACPGDSLCLLGGDGYVHHGYESEKPGDALRTQGGDGRGIGGTPGDSRHPLGGDGDGERDRRYRRGSWRWREAKRIIARRKAREARRRREALHVWTTRLVRNACDLTVVSPRIKQHTQSPRGNAAEWGANVETVSMLNRNTLSQAPASAVQMLTYKAAEASIRCDVIIDEAPLLAVGHDLVAAGKSHRRTKRAIKKELEYV
jgi:hypothetical protein